jgi:hypothetical protein
MNYLKYIIEFVFTQWSGSNLNFEEAEAASHCIEQVFNDAKMVEFKNQYSECFEIECDEFFEWYNKQHDTDFNEEGGYWDYPDSIFTVKADKVPKEALGEYIEFMKYKMNEFENMECAGPNILHIYAWEEDKWKIYYINCSVKDLKTFLKLFPVIKWEIGTDKYFMKIYNKAQSLMIKLRERQEKIK